jgi:hypothetical protein
MLLKAGQGGSGADLCIYLIEVYNKSEIKPDAASKARLVTLLRAFPQDEPAKKKFVGGVVEYVKFPRHPEIERHSSCTFCTGHESRFPCGLKC